MWFEQVIQTSKLEFSYLKNANDKTGSYWGSYLEKVNLFKDFSLVTELHEYLKQWQLLTTIISYLKNLC